MCGLTGLINPKAIADAARVRRMRDQLAHRGPDDAGLWQQGAIALGHRRLAVVDLSAQGHQPMLSANGRYVVAYNGEIYNFQALREQLAIQSWRGNSDTEVLVEAISRWGLERTLNACVGMFALAVWDRQTQSLQLARDRLGIKPLYYGWVGGQFVFASELSAIRLEFSSELSVNRDALSGYMRHYYVPANDSIWGGIRKLPPANILTLDANAQHHQQAPTLNRYWALEASSIEQAQALPEQQTLTAFLEHARQAVGDRMIADVPLGAFLSGGLDSSLVCALMAEQSTSKVNTFTIGFDDKAFDEAPQAAAVAQHLGCQHYSQQVGTQDLLNVVAKLPDLLDEPFADSSIIPTTLVSQLAKQQVTVALSGDGGDELFWGYARYPLWQKLCERLLGLPTPLRDLGASLLQTSGVQALAGLLPTQQLLGSRHPLPSRMTGLAQLMRCTDDAQLYRTLISLWKQPDSLVIGGHEAQTIYSDPNHWTRQLEAWRRISAQDLQAYLPNDILTKVDRASMSVSLEARVPLLDHRMVEFCFALPKAQIRNPMGSKWLLRKALLQYVPAELIDRPKQGFAVPIDAWLRGPLRDWMTDLLSEQRLRQDGYFEPKPITDLVRQHLSGKADWGAYLWGVLMFQVWLHQSTPSLTPDS